MTRCVRKIVTFASVAALLFMQVPQVLAVCACDLSACDRTCDHEPSTEPVVEAPGSCCATRSAETTEGCPPSAEPDVRAACGSQDSAGWSGVSPDTRDAAISKPCCAKGLVVSQDTSSATLPSAPEKGSSRVVASPALQPIVSDASAPEMRVELDALRATPGSAAPHIYLLNASFLI